MAAMGMKLFLRFLFLTALSGASSAEAVAANPPDASAIRAGRNVAVTKCIACHMVSPNPPIQPVLGPGIPSFEEIANRPGTTAESLRADIKNANWHDRAMPTTLLQMNRLSDRESAQVVTYILSLRASHE
jgi:mono/diheme cytochrome c family protein